jgi:hypothetical protein
MKLFLRKIFMNKNVYLGITATITTLVTYSLPVAASNPFEQSIDFNGDGKTDLFWKNFNNGDTAAWLMNGNTIQERATYDNVPESSGWSIRGLGDFNGDGKTDVFWRNSNGDTTGWLMNGNTIQERAAYDNVPESSGWYVQGLGDFNGDGKTDVFWRNSNNGNTAAWLMNGNTIQERAAYDNVPESSGWYVQGFGDFNGDGKTDVFWRNSNNGNTTGWLMNGNTIQERAAYDNVPESSGWYVQGFGDFNGDGKADVFWRNFNNGNTTGWLMNGNTIQERAAYDNVPESSGWSIQNFSDFNGDGKTDVFWRNFNNGNTTGWLMNGNTIQERAAYDNVPQSSGWYSGGRSD